MGRRLGIPIEVINLNETITWHFTKRSLNEHDIQTLEAKLGYRLPEEYKEIIRNYHGARPSKKHFHTQKAKGLMIKTFLPAADEYEVNVVRVKEWAKLPDRMIPFASTPSGDYLCFEYFSPESSPAIILWNHEKREKELISISFNQFLTELY